AAFKPSAEQCRAPSRAMNSLAKDRKAAETERQRPDLRWLNGAWNPSHPPSPVPDRTREQGELMKFTRPVMQMAVLAVVGSTVLAACGSSKPSPTTPGPLAAFGKVPPATGTPHAGTITVAEPPGATPTWEFPVTPGANSSVYTAFSFQYEQW